MTKSHLSLDFAASSRKSKASARTDSCAVSFKPLSCQLAVAYCRALSATSTVVTLDALDLPAYTENPPVYPNTFKHLNLLLLLLLLLNEGAAARHKRPTHALESL
uniref:Uncharacterized protein n=1 Tax=Dunaliella tertiolecta TaxID=3047 RepID=A0A7S3R848_DUNTE